MHGQHTQQPNTGKGIKPINNNGSISIQFQLKGKTYKFSPIKKGKFNDPIALAKAKAIAEQITQDIRLGEFDLTLVKYTLKPHLTVIESIKKPELDIVQLFEKYLDFKKPELKESTLHYLKTSVYDYLVKCPYQNLDNALEIRQWLLSNTTNSMTKRILTHLNAAIKWAIKHRLTNFKVSLFEGMAQELPKHKWEHDPEPNGFTKEEKEEIIEAFKNHQGNWNGRGLTGCKYSHYASLVQFWFLTGCRPSEGIGLTWGQINDDCTQIVFNQALVQLGNGKIVKTDGSKNSRHKKARKFLSTKTLQELLLSIKPDYPSPDDLVFPSPTGKVINYANFCKKAWDRLVDPIAKRNTTPYSCRDTFMSEQISRGIAPEIVARWCDSSADTIRKHYLDDKILEHLRPIE
jgi:integrase